MADFDIASYVSHIEANRSVKDALMQELKARRPPHRVSVTNLTNLKQAYFKRKHPEIVPPLEKQQLMWAGTGFHKIFGSAVSSEEYLEQFVEAEGIVGKIDIYENMPVEVKTTSTPVDREDLLQHRPTYIEQLGIYCAMVNVSQGRIIVYQRQSEGQFQAPLIVYHVTFPNLEAIRDEMRRRRDLLVQALISNDPSNLPICAWFGRQCDYSEVCDCKTSSVPLSHRIAELAGEIQIDDITCRQFLTKLAEPQPSQLFRINDTVFPRKAYFERLEAEKSAPDEEQRQRDKEEYLRSMDELGFIDALRASLLYGVPGEVQSIPIQYASLNDLVRVRQNLPTILRDPKFRSLVDRSQLVWTFPHYFLRLGFECALANYSQGRLLLYYTKVLRENAKLMVYDVSFRKLDAIKAEALHRIELLEKATAPSQLPKCPSWMCPYCSHNFDCGEA